MKRVEIVRLKYQRCAVDEQRKPMLVQEGSQEAEDISNNDALLWTKHLLVHDRRLRDRSNTILIDVRPHMSDEGPVVRHLSNRYVASIRG